MLADPHSSTGCESSLKGNSLSKSPRDRLAIVVLNESLTPRGVAQKSADLSA